MSKVSDRAAQKAAEVAERIRKDAAAKAAGEGSASAPPPPAGARVVPVRPPIQTKGASQVARSFSTTAKVKEHLNVDLKSLRLRPGYERDEGEFALEERNEKTGQVKPSEFAELVESIRRSNGNDRPIEVRLIRGPGDASFEIIAGHRRFRALQLLNQESREAHEADPEKHPYIRFGQAYVAVVDVDDEAADRRHEEENAKRSAKRPFSLAMQLSAMMRSGRYATQEELARNISRDPGDVSLYLKLLDKAPHDLWGRVKDPASLKQSDAKAIVKAYDKPAFADWVKRLDRTGVTPLSTVLKKAKEVCARPKAEKDVVNQVREVKRGDTYHIALPKNLDATVRQDLLKAVRDKLAESGLG